MQNITPNLRDVGGLPARDGREVAPGRLLRSAVPAGEDVGPHGITWPPSVVIDLRSASESEPDHPLSSSGARVVNLPLLGALRPGAAPPESLLDLYLLMIDEAASHLVEVVSEVGTAPGATLIHCAAGKDRTGVSIALLLRLSGVSRDDVLADYLRTADHGQEIAERLSQTAGHSHRTTLPAAFFDVSEDAIVAVLDTWDDHDGGVHGWFRRVGGTDAHVDRLHRTLLT